MEEFRREFWKKINNNIIDEEDLRECEKIDTAYCEWYHHSEGLCSYENFDCKKYCLELCMLDKAEKNFPKINNKFNF